MAEIVAGMATSKARNKHMETSLTLQAVRALEPLVTSAADAIEAERRLPPAIVEAMRKAGGFRMAVPREQGGLELDPLTQIRVVEELSRMDESVGWCTMIRAAVGYIRAFLDPAVAQRLFSDIDAVTEGNYHERLPVSAGDHFHASQ